MRRSVALNACLARQMGENLTILDPRPLVRVRAVYGRAIAVTSTHVLHEWVRWGDYHVRWDQRWQVHRVSPDEWAGEQIG